MADSAKRRHRRQFSDEFKEGAVRLVLDEGKSIGVVARELDLTASALAEWVKRAQADRTKGRTGLTTAEREELIRLRKENRILAEERDILKNDPTRRLPSVWWTRNSRGSTLSAPGQVAVRFLVITNPSKNMVQG
jgi:transposase